MQFQAMEEDLNIQCHNDIMIIADKDLFVQREESFMKIKFYIFFVFSFLACF